MIKESRLRDDDCPSFSDYSDLWVDIQLSEINVINQTLNLPLACAEWCISHLLAKKGTRKRSELQ